MEGQKPTVGRVVHYLHLGGGKCLAAVITDVPHSGDVSLSVFMGPQDNDPNTGAWPAPPVVPITYVHEDQTRQIGRSWHWPERE